jgi:hypothetical protein
MPFQLNVNINLGHDSAPLSPAGSHGSSLGSPAWDPYGTAEALYFTPGTEYAYPSADTTPDAYAHAGTSYFSAPPSPAATGSSTSSGSPLSSPPPSRAPSSGPARAARRAGASPGSPPASARPKKTHQCGLCHKTMSRNYDLHRHLQSVHGLAPAPSVGEELHMPTGPRSWACGACGKAFSRKDSMQRHQRDEGCRTHAQGPRSDA